MKLLIVGKNSFISNHVIGNVTRISLSDISNINLKEYDTLLNCSIHENFRESSYDEKYDFDYAVAKEAYENDLHYVMLSSRKVYGSSNELVIYSEQSKTNPDSFYGENKLISEERIRDLFGNHCVLRCSNVFGLEQNRKTFLGFCIDQLLKTNHILFDINQKTQRDFFPVELLGDIVTKVAAKKITGLFNVGSNFGLQIDRVPLNLIEGYQKGTFSCTGIDKKDQFVLDNQKIKKELDLEINIDFDNHIRNIGKKLCKI